MNQEKKKNRIFLICFLFILVTISLSAFEGFKPGDRCFLIDHKTVLLFSKDNSEISCLKWNNGFSSSVIHKYEGAHPLFIANFRNLSLPDGAVFLTWIEGYDFRTGKDRISGILGDKEKQLIYTVIKEEEYLGEGPHLRCLYLGGGKYRFFCGDVNEEHMVFYESMEYDKIKTFIYSNGKISDERLLNRKGRFSIEDYDVRLTGDNSFQAVWSQEYWVSSKHDIYVASYGADASPLQKPKKIYSFNNVREVKKGENPNDLSSYLTVGFIRDGIFVGRNVRYSPDPFGPDKNKESYSFFEINLFSIEGVRKQSYKTNSGGLFTGYWEQDDMCCFVGDTSRHGKQNYSLKFNALSDKKNFSKLVDVRESKDKIRNYLIVEAEPDGFFYWLEVDDNGNIQLRSIPIEN